MMNIDNYKNFVYHNYQPVNIKKCIETIFVVWFVSILMIFINNRMPIDYLIVCMNLVMTVFYFIAMIKDKKSIVYGFLFDGVSSIHFAIIFNLFAYILLDYRTKLKPFVGFVFLSFLIISALIFSIVVFINIKHDYYSKKKSVVKTGTTLFVTAGIMGVVFSRVFLKNAPEDSMLLVVAVSFLLISIIFTIGVSYFFKIYAYEKIRKHNKKAQEK